MYLYLCSQCQLGTNLLHDGAGESRVASTSSISSGLGLWPPADVDLDAAQPVECQLRVFYKLSRVCSACCPLIWAYTQGGHAVWCWCLHVGCCCHHPAWPDLASLAAPPSPCSACSTEFMQALPRHCQAYGADTSRPSGAEEERPPA